MSFEANAGRMTVQVVFRRGAGGRERCASVIRSWVPFAAGGGGEALASGCGRSPQLPRRGRRLGWRGAGGAGRQVDRTPIRRGGSIVVAERSPKWQVGDGLR
jgi:hypothetical protein